MSVELSKALQKSLLPKMVALMYEIHFDLNYTFIFLRIYLIVLQTPQYTFKQRLGHIHQIIKPVKEKSLRTKHNWIIRRISVKEIFGTSQCLNICRTCYATLDCLNGRLSFFASLRLIIDHIIRSL